MPTREQFQYFCFVLFIFSLFCTKREPVDDILEEDIEGRERFLFEDDDDDDYYTHRQIKVSYGPYEYWPYDD